MCRRLKMTTQDYDATMTWYLQDGIKETSAVTTLSIPRLDRAPLTTPHENARN